MTLEEIRALVKEDLASVERRNLARALKALFRWLTRLRSTLFQGVASGYDLMLS